MSDQERHFGPEFLADFEILEVVGAGGMARVYKAHQKALGRVVAIKLLAPQAFSEEDSRPRFEREREITSRIKHPNVVPLLSFGETNGRPYLVFEFVDGPSLRDVLLREGKLSLVRALATARQIAQGLAAAHAAGIVHRDLKPDNVLIGPDGEARVADFGLARPLEQGTTRRLTQTGIILGTPGYLAPELIRGDPATPAADLFSLGIMLHEMITGKLPMEAGSEHELLVRYLREDQPSIAERGVTVPARVERIAAALLRRDVSRRPGDASKLVEALQVAEAKGDAPDGPLTRPRSRGDLDMPTSKSNRLLTPRLTPFSGARFARRHPRVTAAMIGMVLAVLVGGVAGVMFLARPAPPPRAHLRVTVEPAVVPGVTCASLRWQTNVVAPTSVWIWREGELEERGLPVLPPRQAPPEGTRHELTVRGLQAESRWWFRVMFPDGSRSPDKWPIELKSDIANLVGPPTYTYADASTLRIAFDLKADVTAAAHLEGPGDPEVVQAPQRGAGRVTLRVPLRDTAATFTPVIRFLELEDPDPRQEAQNRVRLAPVPAPGALRVAVTALFGAKPLDMHPYTADVLRVGAKFYTVHAGGLPSKEAVRTLKDAQRRELLAQAWAEVRRRLYDARRVDLELVRSALPVWRADPTLVGDDRRRLHEALMKLADLDGASQLVSGVPLLDVDGQLGLRVPASAGEAIPATAFRPLARFDDPEIVKMMGAHAFPVFTHLTWPDDPGVMTAADLADSMVGGVIDTAKKLAVPDTGTIETATGMWTRLPDLPAGFPTERRLRIVLKVTSLSPDYRLWLRIGGAKVCFRSTLQEFRGYLSMPLKPLRTDVERNAIPMAMELPEGYCEPGTQLIQVRLEAFSPRGGMRQLAPMTCWLSELALIPR